MTNPDGTLKNLKGAENDAGDLIGVIFDCPMPGCTHRQYIPTTPESGYKTIWGLTGELPNITLSPSIRNIPMKDHTGELAGCAAHYFVRDGKVEMCSDSGQGAGRTW